MSYQERIYNQNGKCDRNFVGPVPTLSSDICVFNRPGFTMYGASSIDCSTGTTCDISGVSYNDIFSATTECFIESAMSGSCFNSIDWYTSIYEDGILAYNDNFFVSTGVTGDIPTITEFSSSVVSAFNSLGYDYTFSGTSYTIAENEGEVTNVKLMISAELDYDVTCLVTGNTTGDTSCGCPSGYTATTAFDTCESLIYTAVTLNPSGLTAVGTGVPNPAYGATGALFYPKINGMSLPLSRSGSTVNLKQFSGAGVAYDLQVLSEFWGKWPNSWATYGRLNATGVRKTNLPLTEWVGFASCIDIPTSGTYYIGIGADNRCRFKLDGKTILNLEIDDVYNHKVWHMLPVELTSGIHIVEMEGRNDDNSTATSFGAEIYSASLEDLTGSTMTGTTGLIFSSADERGGVFNLGTVTGYSCPPGYALDACFTGASRCVLIGETDIECTFTGDCTTTDIVCDLEFDSTFELSGQTGVTLDFMFTENVESLETSNFSFEIYKYLPQFGYFDSTSIYISDSYEWSSFSGTSALTATVPVNSLSPDGEYLIKGHFTYDLCTEFASLLGQKGSTKTRISGEEYGIYQPSRDKYFVAFTEADKPELELDAGDGDIEDNGNVNGIGSLVSNSIILDGTTSEFDLASSGSEYIISLNGLTLAQNYDYSIKFVDVGGANVNLLSLSANTVSGDVLTFAYTVGETSSTLMSDTIDVDSPILSGVTDGQGSNTIYFNTDTGKYEMFISMTPVSDNSIGITINGVTMARNIDYYQSTSNPKRIIFEGVILLNDIINAYYATSTNVLGDQFGNYISVAWSINNAPTEVNGIFTVEISSDENFTTIVSSATTEYVIGSIGYSQSVNLVGSVGDKQYYRVKNEKNFVTLCDKTLTSDTYSETGNITIQTNTNNSY